VGPDLGAPPVLMRSPRVAAAATALILALPVAGAAGERAAAATSPSASATSAEKSRPGNGAVLVRRGSGPGALVVESDITRDGYVTLARGRKAVLTIYVRAAGSARLEGVPDGTYTVYFTAGRGWSSKTRNFTRNVVAYRFDQRLTYTTWTTAFSRSSSEWTVTLYAVPNGNASTSPVSPASIPR
jgi:hypothetical protein